MEKALYLKTITFNTNGGSKVPEQKLLMGETVTRPADPVKEGSTFSGWFTDNDTFAEEWVFGFEPEKDVTLYAKWYEVIAGKIVITSINFPQASSITYGQELYDSALTGGDVLLGSFKWVKPDIQPEVSNSGFEVIFTPFNIDDYDFSGVEGWDSAANTLTRNVLITVNPAPIAYSPVTITGPMKGQLPSAIAYCEGHFTLGDVTWTTSNPVWTQGSEFLPLTVYTASVTLTANANYSFNSDSTASINGNAAEIAANTGNTITILYTFAPTLEKTVANMTINESPAGQYIHGDTLDLSKLKVLLEYDDGTSEIVEYINFTDKNIGTNYSHGMSLSRSEHHGDIISVSIGSIELDAVTLSVNQKPISIKSITHTKKYDTTTGVIIDSHLIELEGILPVDNGFVHVGTISAEYTSAGAGTKTINILGITLAGNAADNYYIASPVNFEVVGGITKADGSAVTAPVAAIDPFEPKITITTLSLLVDATGQNIEYALYNGTSLSAYGTSTVFDNLPAGIYRVYARSSSDTNYNAGTPSVSSPVYISPLTFDISIDKITDGDIQFNLASGIILSRTADGNQKSAVISVSNAGTSSVKWYYDNAEIETGTSIILSVSNNPTEAGYTNPYNIVGTNLITVVVTINGVDYSKVIEFEVRP